MKICLASDHGGYELKEALKVYLLEEGIHVHDVGCHSAEAVDYPDFAAQCAREVSMGEADRGIVVCTSGIGVSMVANKFPRIRAALCRTVEDAEMSRRHNHANMLALGATHHTKEDALAILSVFLKTNPEGGRHARRVDKIDSHVNSIAEPVSMERVDHEVYEALRAETRRREGTLNLIASENTTSRAVREALGSIFSDKYANGVPGKRAYGGCTHMDEVERLAIDRARLLFGSEHVNVQPYSGVSANLAVYLAVLQPGDRVLAMDPSIGGHPSHGAPGSLAASLFSFSFYGLDAASELIDYSALQRLAEENKPKLIVVGPSAYSRLIDVTRLRKIADSVGAYLWVDAAHLAGCIAAGCHPNPSTYCEFLTATTHKTLRGPHGGFIGCQQRFAADIDRVVSHQLQGGPLMNVVAAKAVCFAEALLPLYKEYIQQTIRNAQHLSVNMSDSMHVLSGGTDSHMLLLDISGLGLPVGKVNKALERAGILADAHSWPLGQEKKGVILRVGTAALTSLGMQEEHMDDVAAFLRQALEQASSTKSLHTLHDRISEWLSTFQTTSHAWA